MIQVGIAGIGFMGVTHYKAWQQIAQAKVAALCTRDERKRAGDWSGIKGNFGDDGGKQDLADVACHETYEQLLTDDAVQLIDICLPTPLHRRTVLDAFEAGKHVVVEKPIALTLEDADVMIDAARANGKLLMVAQVLRFWPQWQWLKQQVDSGALGKLLGLSLQRVIATPHWSKSIADMGANGGPLIDLHIHDTDFVLYLLGKPNAVHAQGLVQDDFVRYLTTNYIYNQGPIVNCRSGAITTKGRPFQHGFEAYFQKATVSYAVATEPADNDPAQRCSSQQILTVYHEDATVTHPDTGSEDGFIGQLRHAAQCVADNKPSSIIAGEQARQSLAVVLAERESVMSGKIVQL